MPLHVLLRAISVLIVIVFVWLIPDYATERWVIFSLGFAHYFLSLVYAQGPLARVVSQPTTLLASVGLVIAGAALYLNQFSLLIYFAIHHVFNEVYLLGRVGPLQDQRATQALRIISVLLHFCLYCALLRHHAELEFLPRGLLFATLALSYLAFFIVLRRLKKELKLRALIDVGAFEVLGLLLLAASFFVRINFLHIVLYHFVFWSLFPLAKLAQQGRHKVRNYLVLNAAATIIFLLISPLGLLRSHWLSAHWEEQFRFWSYLHITLSFAVSSAHPGWITRWFQPTSLMNRSQSVARSSSEMEVR